MNELVFLLDEPSMREALQGLVPRLIPPEVTPVYVTHEGKADLERSIPRKLRAWGNPEARFIILRDQESGDCHVVKRRIRRICVQAGRPDAVVRIVCHHLEAWFLGDLPAVEAAFGMRGLATLAGRRHLRDPDALPNASQELKKLVSGYQKRSGARAIGAHLSVEGNRSRSFRVFVEGLRRLVQ